jgi:Arc/MetJ family transcription regulator
MKRTSVVLDEKLLSRAKKVTGIKTTRMLLDYALRQLIRIGRQADLLKLKGKVHWEGDLDELRKTRDLGQS